MKFQVGDTVISHYPKESRMLATVKRIFEGRGGAQVTAQTKRGHVMTANEDWFGKVVWTATDRLLA